VTRDGVPDPPEPAVDEYSPTIAPPSAPSRSLQPSATTDAATGVPKRVEDGVDVLVGTVLAGRYRIDRRVGAGGMGAVYVGLHVELDKRVALKVVQPRLGADPTIAQRFVQEARAASAIGHEHIVQITDFGRTDDGAAFLVMEYLDGEDLADTLRRDGPLPWPRVLHIVEQIAWALAAAHRQGIVHRDIKPANCYRVPREHDPDFIKVLDFGLAKVLAQDRDGESLTGTGMLLGTPGYIAPELYRGLKADHRVDIYALGALMHKLLTGELPPMASGSGAQTGGLRALAIPDAVEAVLAKALREAPDERHATAQDLAQALRAIPRASPDEPTMAGPNSSPSTAATRPGAAQRDPSSAGAITLREPTPSTFPSLFAVERDGQRVRFYIGAPVLVVLLGLIVGLVWWATRTPALPGTVATAPAMDTLPAPVAAPPVEPAAPTAPANPPAAPLAPPVQPPPVQPPPAPPPDVTTPPADTSAGPTAPSFDPAPAPALPRGTVKALSRHLTKHCLRTNTLGISQTFELRWETDEHGALIPGTVSSKDTDTKGIIECAVEKTRTSAFAWRPRGRYKETLTLGKPRTEPPPDAPAP